MSVNLDELFGAPPAVNNNYNHNNNVPSDLPPPPPYSETMSPTITTAAPAQNNGTWIAPPPPQGGNPYGNIPSNHPGSPNYSTSNGGSAAPYYTPSPPNMNANPAPSYPGQAGGPYSPGPTAAQSYPQPQQQPAYGGGYLANPAPTTTEGCGASQEDEDRRQLEKIMKLRRELELEQEREREKKEAATTWPCVECTYRNKLTANTCEMCGTLRPGAAQPVTHAPSPSVARPSAAVAGITAWQCPQCYAPNEAACTQCKMCRAPRPPGSSIPRDGKAPTVHGGATMQTNWRCSVCGTVNPPSNLNCKVCNGYQRNGTPVAGPSITVPVAAVARPPTSADPPPPTTWNCSVCTFENSVRNAVCSACQSGQRPRHLAPTLHAGSASASHPHAAPAASHEAQKKWACEECTFLNKLCRSKCDMCGSARPERFTEMARRVETEKEKKENKKREEQSDDEEIQWQQDQHAQECNRCRQPFGLMRRRHHCRACGYVFCATCSPYYLTVKKGGEPERVCVSCYESRTKGK